ncbi:MAG: hypothetical protein ACXIUM_02965 [Wenzhouxiangella sp.]
MKRITLALLGLLALTPAWGLGPISDEDIAVLHWAPETAAQAMLRTRALELWLADRDADPQDWRRQVDLRLINLERQAPRWMPLGSSAVDGRLGWLIQAQAQDWSAPSNAERLGRSLLTSIEQGALIHPLPAQTRLGAEAAWRGLRARLQDAAVPEAEAQIAALWAGLRAIPMSVEEREHALMQVRRARELPALTPTEARLRALAEIAGAESLAAWQRGDDLPALWLLLEALVLELPKPRAAAVGTLLAGIEEMALAGEARQRQIDQGFPVLLAQLKDAAEYLIAEPPRLGLAVTELLDAYFRLAYFMPDAAFYLDQPVREEISQALSDCMINPELVGPLPRQMFEQCPERLFGLLRDGLASEELVGVGGGPFAPEFLRRELGLLSWQRAAYLDGFLDWTLQSSCEAPAWVNVLEWSVLVHSLAEWVPQRPVFFGSPRWQEAMDELIEAMQSRQEAQEAWLDCISGFGGQRRDPVSRLMRLHDRALTELDAALQAAYREFLVELTRPGADVTLSAGADQLTTYRPEGLSVLPCSGGETCGARVELAVSRALLGLFPNTYLLADQLGMGRLGLCYDEVRWVDREMQQARPQDPLVANFYGRLSFELVGTFDDGSSAELVFRQRLTSAERSHYLFAEASEELLDLECPLSLSARPLASRLAEQRRGLVPDRLTYFVSTPVTADSKLAANWDRGAEWRDWFLTGERIEIMQMPQSEVLFARVQAELEALAERRERRIFTRLLDSANGDPLSEAMASVTDNAALLRRVLEIHYPRLLRHDTALRATLMGSQSLLGRDQLRQFRDSRQAFTELAADGRERLLLLQSFWESLPDVLREQGQIAPESELALGQLLELQALTRPLLPAVESSPEP